jgi:hypothetical protein
VKAGPGIDLDPMDPILADAAATPVTIALPWTAPTAPPTKGISYDAAFCRQSLAKMVFR